MNDPYVEMLRYRLLTNEDVSFDASPIQEDTDDFEILLKDDQLVVKPKKYFASVEHARSDIDPYIRAWEIQAGLKYGSDEITFEFRNADLLKDRNPDTSSKKHTAKVVMDSMSAIEKIKVKITRSHYPNWSCPGLVAGTHSQRRNAGDAAPDQGRQ